ncbi:MAG: hypothetical protein KDD55_09615 [Bdellovibrionales bacterium]|nr:hypothetical protein [Bdellovibrionales bacterium]
MSIRKRYLKHEGGVSEVKLALVLFVFSLLGMGSCIPFLQEASNARLVFDLPLQLGEKSTYVVLDGQCVAEFSQTLIETEPMKLLLTATLLSNTEHPPRLTLEALFNNLGQLLSSTLLLRDGDFSLEMKTASVHPVSLTTLSYDKERALTKALILPGPISLKKITDGQFLLDLSYAITSSDSQLQQWLTLTENSLLSPRMALSSEEQACHPQNKISQTPSLETLLRAFLHSEHGEHQWTTKL